MYKVFVNESLVLFSENLPAKRSDKFLMARPEKAEGIIRALLSGIYSEADYLIPLNDEDALRFLTSTFEQVKAAGGVVLNAEGKILWIFRRNKWDLPKGKTDKGESEEQTALREVSEECGIKNLSIRKYLGKSFHIYPICKGKKAVFKTTHFFLMETRDTDFVPQAEEEIMEIRFFDRHDPTPFSNTYRSLKEFLEDNPL